MNTNQIFDEKLSADIKWCAWNIAWYRTNIHYGFDSGIFINRREADVAEMAEHCYPILAGAGGDEFNGDPKT